MKRVNRNLELGPGHYSGGPDVAAFKHAVARELKHLRLGFLIHFDSARRSQKTIAHAIFALGLTDAARRAALKGHVGKWTQRKVRNPVLRSPADRLRARRRKPTLRKWREHHREPIAVVMYDSVTLSEIPADAPAVAGYTGGNWPTFHELADAFPHALTLSIAISASEDAECLDVEPGDASPAEAPAWVRRQHARGIKRPVVYGSVSQAEEIIAALAAAGIRRDGFLLWTAHYGTGDHICGPSTCGYPGLRHDADATQWTSEAHGRNLDQSALRPRFFPDLKQH